MRGEHLTLSQWNGPSGGPSPRARGAPGHHAARRHHGGTIPACAGSTATPLTSRPTSGDHPRVRGEHDLFAAHMETLRGPSPRARGAPVRRTRGRGWWGTIPACAGSTYVVRPGYRGRWDHPRVRGEHRKVVRTAFERPGPSPRARGAHGVDDGVAPDGGTIPACAGSTHRHRRTSSCPGDHPRVRGEHAPTRRVVEIHEGPSPRARGAQSLTWELTSDKRPIFQLLEKQTFHPQIQGKTDWCLHTSSGPHPTRHS